MKYNTLLRPKRVLILLVMSFNGFFPTKLYLKILYFLYIGKKLDLNNPQTFSEKIQWLKIFDRNPNYVRMVDKCAVKEYVGKKIGFEYIIPTLGIWDSPQKIDWESLPDRFVLKTTHGGGSSGVVICTDKKNLDINCAITKLNRSIKQDIWHKLREWPYKNVTPQIIAESYIPPENGSLDLSDYKWYCFNGKPLFCQVIQDRHSKETIDFFNANWEHQNFVGLNPIALNANIRPVRPSSLGTQVKIAKILSKDIPFVRVDLYEVKGKVYFGEMTFYPASGMGLFRPAEYNNRLGDLIELPIKYKNR